MILNDKQIKKLVEEQDMIKPFVDKSVSQGISHGLNSFGFDLRCGEEFKVCLLYTSPSPRDLSTSRMPSSA